ncbi:hypothetical protein ACJX0J_008187, partial [Zea mays]
MASLSDNISNIHFHLVASIQICLLLLNLWTKIIIECVIFSDRAFSGDYILTKMAASLGFEISILFNFNYLSDAIFICFMNCHELFIFKMYPPLNFIAIFVLALSLLNFRSAGYFLDTIHNLVDSCAYGLSLLLTGQISQHLALLLLYIVFINGSNGSMQEAHDPQNVS